MCQCRCSAFVQHIKITENIKTFLFPVMYFRMHYNYNLKMSDPYMPEKFQN